MYIKTIIEKWKEEGREATFCYLKSHQPAPEPLSFNNLRKSLDRVIARHKKLNSNRVSAKEIERYECFLNSAFNFPVVKAPPSVPKQLSELHPHFQCGHEGAAASLAVELALVEERNRTLELEGVEKKKALAQYNSNEALMAQRLARVSKVIKMTQKRESYVRAKLACLCDEEDDDDACSDMDLEEIVDNCRKRKHLGTTDMHKDGGPIRKSRRNRKRPSYGAHFEYAFDAIVKSESDMEDADKDGRCISRWTDRGRGKDKEEHHLDRSGLSNEDILSELEYMEERVKEKDEANRSLLHELTCARREADELRSEITRRDSQIASLADGFFSLNSQFQKIQHQFASFLSSTAVKNSQLGIMSNNNNVLFANGS